MRQRIKVGHIKKGWSDEGFIEDLDQLIFEQEKQGYSFKDIKIESGGSNSLVIFERNTDMGIVTKGPEEIRPMGLGSIKKETE